MQAYLILAHGDFGVLEKLIRMLDHPENDIYLHMDAKVENFDFDRFSKIPEKSRLIFTDRVSVEWGDFSMVRAEFILLRAALESGTAYRYLHLISGVDLPLMPADRLNAFFEAAYPQNFIHFSGGMNAVEESRIKHYHFFAGRRNFMNRAMTKLEQKLGELFRVDRTHGEPIYRGSQWFSITGDFGAYLLARQAEIEKRYRHTLIPDEFVVQNAFMRSPFADTLYVKRFDDSSEQNMRCIDWTRGAPYTFGPDDLDEIFASKMLFVRKLTDRNELPQKIFQQVTQTK